MGGKTKEQLLEELSEVQKMLEERTETQGQMIKRFKTLIENEGLFSQVIDFFPYPLVIFTPQYTLAMTNKALRRKQNACYVSGKRSRTHSSTQDQRCATG